MRTAWLRCVVLGTSAFVGLTEVSFAQSRAQHDDRSLSPASLTEGGDDLAFDVVSIKDSNDTTKGSHAGSAGSLFTATGVTVLTIMQYEAFGISASRIIGLPSWALVKRFDIKASFSPTLLQEIRSARPTQVRSDTQIPFRSMLVTRFGMSAHWETREMPVYALRVDRKGLKLQPSNGRGGGTSTTSGHYTAANISLSELAASMTNELTSEIGRVIVDQTNLDGRYDVDLRWGPFPDNSDATSGSEPSLFTAFRETLGLRLVSTQAPVRVLVIDTLTLPTPD